MPGRTRSQIPPPQPSIRTPSPPPLPPQLPPSPPINIPRRQRLNLVPDDDQEDFNFAGISTASNDQLAPGHPHSNTSMQPSAGSSTRPASPATGEPPQASGSRALDIKYYFAKGSKKEGTKTVCKVCRANPETKVSYEFAPTTSNSTLRGHLERVHKDEYLEFSKLGRWPNQLISRSQNEEPSAPLNRSKFTQAAFLKHLIDFIIVNDQSLNVVECPEFRNLLLLLREDLQDKDIPRRTKIRESIINAWKAYFSTLVIELANSAGKISCTADIWSNKSRYPFIALTGHWISKTKSNNLELKSALLALHRIRGSHRGERLARIVLSLLDRVNITVKIGHWTLDNASVNDVFLEELEKLLVAREIPFDHKDNHVMCFPHIINITVTHVIKSLTNPSLADDDAEFTGSFTPDHEGQTYEEALQRDPIALCRGAVISIRASGKRRDQLSDVIEDGNKKNWFMNPDKPNEVVKVKPLELLRDVRHRWDSLYKMINRYRMMRPAVDYFLSNPMFRSDPLAKLRMTPKEWEVLQDFEMILNVPHRVQTIMCAERTPVLSCAVPAFEMFMTVWESLQTKYPHLARFITPGLESAVKYYRKMDNTRAYLVTMVLHPAMRMSYVRLNWGDDYYWKAVDAVKDLMAEYRARKATANASAVDPTATSIPNTNPQEGFNLDNLADRYGLQDLMGFTNEPEQEQSIEDEFTSYVSAPLSPMNTDILKFWQLNESRLPTFYAIALDYLAIQASAVPCERAFSSAAETDVNRRNRIHPVLFEALQMLKFSLKKERLNFTEGLETQESEMLLPSDEEVDQLSQVESWSNRGMDEVLAALGQGDDE